MKTNSMRRIACGCLLALGAAPAAAQPDDGPPWRGAAGVRLETYAFGQAETVGIDVVSLLTVPFAAEARVAGRVHVALSGAFATARLARPDGGEATLSGLTDTELRVSVPVVGDWLTVTGTAVLPTGKETLSAEELEVAAVIASDLLPFAISHWGSGGGIGAGVSATRRWGAVGVGASGGYRASREYRAFQDGAAYRPGDEAFLRVAVDRAVGPGRATLQAGIHRYAHDELEGGNLYRAGDRYQLIGSYAFTGARRTSGVVYAGLLHRQNGATLADFSEDFPAQNLLLVGTGLRVPVRRGALLPSVDARLLRSEDGVGQGWGVGAGASAEWPAGAVTLVPSARLRYGRVLVLEGAESRFTGVELGFTLRRGTR